MIEFYLILAACTAIAVGVFWRLMIIIMVMLVGGYLGEAGFINATVGFVIGMAGWGYILYEIFAGSWQSCAIAHLRPCNQPSTNASNCDCWLGYLSSRIFLRLYDWRRRRKFAELDLQRC